MRIAETRLMLSHMTMFPSLPASQEHFFNLRLVIIEFSTHFPRILLVYYLKLRTKSNQWHTGKCSGCDRQLPGSIPTQGVFFTFSQHCFFTSEFCASQKAAAV
jgi:hypothetical protein